jgi:LCP family protein required for cell wall assembly
MTAHPVSGGPPNGGHYGVRLAARLVISLLSLLVIIGSGWAWATFKSFTDHIPHGPAVPGLNGAADIDGKATDILLTGNDSRAGATPDELKALSTAQDGGSVNTDTMMVLHIPADGSRATIISFPRDSWVDIPGHGRGKINSAYGIGYTAAKDAGKSERNAEGAGLLMTIKTIDQLTGLHIDHYMQVDLLGFYRISNAIGGVTVCLNAAQNASTDSDAYGRGYSGINLPKGVSTIKGSQALAFVRQRHGLPRGDLDRIARQQYFLSAAFKKVETGGVLLNPFKLHRLLDAVGSSLLTDPSLNLLSLGREFALMSDGNITYKTIPNNGPALIYPDGVETSVVDVNTAAIPAFLRDLDHGSADSAYQAAKAAPPSRVTVDVLNGTDVVGLAGRNGDRLKALGFGVATVDSTDATTSTTVEYPAGKEAQAKALANAVYGAKVSENASVTRVTLVLGTNGVQVNGLTSPTGPASQSAPTRTTSKPVAKPSSAPAIGCIN